MILQQLMLHKQLPIFPSGMNWSTIGPINHSLSRVLYPLNKCFMLLLLCHSMIHLTIGERLSNQMFFQPKVAYDACSSTGQCTFFTAAPRHYEFFEAQDLGRHRNQLPLKQCSAAAHVGHCTVSVTG